MSLSRTYGARLAAVALTSVVALAALTACSGGDSDSDATPDADASSSGGAAQVAVTLSGNSCTVDTGTDDGTVAAGPVTFTVTNQDAAGITEVELLSDQRILGEKENLAPGLGSVEFTSTLGGGTYQVYCPGADEDMIDLTVAGEAIAPTGSTQELLAQGAKDYATYVDTQVAAMVAGVQGLQQAVDSGDLAAAQAAYAKARPFYERIESDVDGFVLQGFDATDNHGNLDYLIDMRRSNLDPAVGWHGFHAVERDLFGRQRITASTKKLAAELTKNVTKLSDLVATLDYKPEDLANGAAGLLEEVQANKITGEEEAFSHIDLVDFAGNVEGAQESFAYLKPGLKEIDASLTDTISQRFDSVNQLLDTYRDPQALGGYVTYTQKLQDADSNKLAQSVQALQDALSRLAEKVATA